MKANVKSPPPADRLFRHPWRFVAEVPSIDAMPPEGPPEVAFAGRSNVGKSSLINALTGQTGLARTSNTPGRTQALIFFVPDLPEEGDGALPRIALIDMPGYGYAKAPKGLVDAWNALIEAYLKGRASLKRVFLLVDARHGLKSSDEALMDKLDRAAVPYQVVLTKADKLKPSELAAMEAGTSDKIRKRPAAHPHVIATSSETRLGIDALRSEIAAFSRAA
jgi:GTP-binding protein